MYNIVMQQRENRYRTINNNCGNIEYYIKKNNKINKKYCNRITCGRCREKTIVHKLDDVVCIAEENNLRIHFVITLPGEDFRKYIDEDQSFNYLPHKWNSFKIYYKRSFNKKICYIAFFRSTENGYAHLHILINRYIPKEWIEKTLKNIKLGFCKIKYVDIQRIKNYLSKYWYKEHEWFIPKNKKHFTSSRDIKFKKYEPSKDDIIILGIGCIKGKSKIDVFYDLICNNVHDGDHGSYLWGYAPPFEYILGEYYAKIL